MKTPNDCPHSLPTVKDDGTEVPPACPLPCKERVIYGGRLDSPVVILGQSPGEEEVRVGEPFVGPSGQELRNALADAGWDPNDLLYANAVQCCPENNATPKEKQIRLCSDNLRSVLDAAPRVLIIALGNEAKCAVLGGRSSGVTNSAGTIFPHSEYGSVLWTFHPAFILRDRAYASTFLSHLKKAREIVTSGPPQLPVIDWHCIHPEHEWLSAGWLSTIKESRTVSFDVETTGLDCYNENDQLLGVGLGFGPPDGRWYVYVSICHGNEARLVWEPKDWISVYEWLKLALDAAKGKVICHEAAFDVQWVYQRLLIDVLPVAADSMLLIPDENRSRGLKESAIGYLGAVNWATTWTDEKGKTLEWYKDSANVHLGMVPVAEVAKYCCLDCYYTERLLDYGQAQATERGLELFRRVQTPLSTRLIQIERRGMAVDAAGLEALGVTLREEAEVAEVELNTLLGTTEEVLPHRKDKRKGVKISSLDDLSYGLFGILGLPRLPDHQTPGGKASLNEDSLQALRTLAVDERAVRTLALIDLYRGRLKTASTYVDGVLKYVVDGRVHPRFSQAGTVTGRLACRSPNLQNVPDSLRRYYVAPDGWSFVEADYSQLEVRVLGHYSEDQVLLRALQESDFHSWAAGMAFGKPAEQITKEERSAGKVVVFGGFCYGGGAPTISAELSKPPPDWTGGYYPQVSIIQAQGLLDAYIRAFPQAWGWLQSQKEFASKFGYVESDLGRRRHLHNIRHSDKDKRHSEERMALNSTIQCTASDICNIALLKLCKSLELGGAEAYVCNTVHDSLLVCAPDGEVGPVQDVMQACMTQQPYGGFTVPLPVEIKVYRRWGEKEDEDNG